MPLLSRQDSSFGPSSRSSLNSVGSAILDRIRGFGPSSKQQKALEERYVRPLTTRNVETFVEDQRIDDATSNKNRSMDVQVKFWLKTLPEVSPPVEMPVIIEQD